MKEIIDLLQSHHWMGQSKNIDIAKGKYEMTLTWSGMIDKIKRIFINHKIKE